ncbi:hypothetical protein BAME_29380 [Bacillus sp. M 2-6]|nr:hypothetical protein BAME_29380 [Bacillus sp. M 2-6]
MRGFVYTLTPPLILGGASSASSSFVSFFKRPLIQRCGRSSLK